MRDVAVTGGFDDLTLEHVRFLEEAARLGRVHVVLWSDRAVESFAGRRCRFPEQERLYLLQAIRYVHSVTLSPDSFGPDTLPRIDGVAPAVWVADEENDRPARRAWCASQGLEYRVLGTQELKRVPAPQRRPVALTARKRVVVTGCYDWFHSGHVRFFEEVSELGDLYVVVGHDANIRLLKGDGHPMLPEAHRWYMVQSVRYVTQALISTGRGWMDGEPEFARIHPDLYVVNEDGDRPEKRAFCERFEVEYRVLSRRPKEGLPRRQSTDLRGF
jgi:cytidyltransferase-like protein